MLIVYRLLINLIFILSPIIFVIRFLKKKEDPKRFIEKLGFFSKKNVRNEKLFFRVKLLQTSS